MDKSTPVNHKLLSIAFLTIIVTFACRIGAMPSTKITPSTPTQYPIQPTETFFPTISLDTEVIIPELQFTEISPINSADEAIWIQSPLSGEQISDEILLQGIADPTFEQNLGIRLVGENGSEIFQGGTIIKLEAGTRGEFALTIDTADIPTQPAILQVFSTSAKDGSLIHLSSVIIQIRSGNNSDTSTNSNDERISISNITQPSLNSNHEVIVTGSAWGSFENTLNYAVCGENPGNDPDLICGSLDNRLIDSVVTTNASDMGLPGNFEISISNTNTFPPSATIVVYSVSPMNGAIDHACSQSLFQQQ
jgi:hypothetical protein